MSATERKEQLCVRPRVATNKPFQKEKRTAMGAFLFLEQVTRVELAGNSLGSCRHTARRHLRFALKLSLSPQRYLLYILFNKMSTVFFAFHGFSVKFARQKTPTPAPRYWNILDTCRKILHCIPRPKNHSPPSPKALSATSLLP